MRRQTVTFVLELARLLYLDVGFVFCLSMNRFTFFLCPSFLAMV
jgi:hypothetical protein